KPHEVARSPNEVNPLHICRLDGVARTENLAAPGPQIDRFRPAAADEHERIATAAAGDRNLRYAGPLVADVADRALLLPAGLPAERIVACRSGYDRRVA